MLAERSEAYRDKLVYQNQKSLEIKSSKKNVNFSVDKSDMRRVILDFPKQFKVGFEAAKHISPTSLSCILNSIVICGMGGSALPGELLKLISANYLHSKIGIHIHRNYRLPYYISKNSLVVCISYSGNTEETLSSYLEAKKRNLKIISVASGGRLTELSKKHKTPIAIIPSGIQPRCALGYQFAALIKILENLKIIKNIEKEILNAAENLKPEKLEDPGKNLAKKLLDKIPIIYSSQRYKALSYIWKIKFNENSKMSAFWNYFPELNHNEIVGYSTKFLISNFQFPIFNVLILKDSDDHPRILKRMSLTAALLRKNGIPVDFIEIFGKNIWEKMLLSLILADWTSYWLAIFRGLDPTPVEMVEEFKKKLK